MRMPPQHAPQLHLEQDYGSAPRYQLGYSNLGVSVDPSSEMNDYSPMPNLASLRDQALV